MLECLLSDALVCASSVAVFDRLYVSMGSVSDVYGMCDVPMIILHIFESGWAEAQSYLPNTNLGVITSICRAQSI
jgi:hypothetical protein